MGPDLRAPVALSIVLALAGTAVGEDPAAEPEGGAGAKAVRATVVRSGDGLEIACDVRGRPGGPTLVFVHGWCGDRSFWKHQLDAFADRHRVASLDLGGHGKSGKDREVWSVEALAGDVVAVVEALDLERVVLVGHSMGGPISLLAAKRLPGRVVAVVGVDTLHNAEFRWPEEQTKEWLASMEADFEGMTRGFLKGTLPETVDPETVRHITETVLAADRRMALGVMRALSAFDAKTALAGAKVPVRCINAAPGRPFALATAVEVNRKHADFDAVFMEGVGHFPMLEKPAEFNAKLRAVLEKLAGAAKVRDPQEARRAAMAKCKEYYDAVMLWRVIRKESPTSLEDLEAPLKEGEAPFLKVEPDPWGNLYALEFEGKSPRVYSFGPDGIEGTRDDIAYPPPKDE